ncbi:hypothetical protein Pfo_020809 [Paulownia fortunei]|nr:hypothetical protein Pfo_020809 [Paulownia fortunei]
MAYAALVSLKQTIQCLLNSSQISILPPSPEIRKLMYEIRSSQKFLKRLDSSSGERVNAFDEQIREAACELEDALESHASNQILSQYEEIQGDESYPLLFSVDLIREVEQEIDTFTQRVNEMEEVFRKKVFNRLPEEDDAVSSRIDFGGKKQNVFGLSDELGEIKDLLSEQWSSKLKTVSICGMAGIGKTTLAKEIFEDPSILSLFDHRSWVTAGPKCKLKKIMRGVLAQVNPEIDVMLMEGDEELADYLHKSLKDRKYLIVLDDIWNKHVRDELKRLLPDDNNGSRVLLTTRLYKVALAESLFEYHSKCNMNKEESWYLLREMVFGEESCPSHLENAGKKIAENCEGLPLSVVTVARLLSKSEKTPEYWNKVAEKENSVFMDAYDEMSKVLLPSYEYLRQHLKACFLYMGVFPQNYEIPRSKLIKLWIAEGFLEPNPSKTVEDFAVQCLRELGDCSLVLDKLSSSSKTKTCGLHSVFWHLCKREAGKNKFFHVLNSYADGLAEGIKSQRRLCIHKSILFGIKDVYNSMASISTVRSLLCTGPYHQYPVPLCLGLRLLRVLDALTIRFYKFPIEVLKLVQLRYLALTYNGKLPASISKLWNLQCLIVRRHLIIQSTGDPSYLPMEIWDMQELKHLQFMGSNLPDPCGSLLPNLLTLSDLSAQSCTKGVFESIPNLKRLGIRIELAPDAAESLCCFDHISYLHGLETLKCVIVNPRSEAVAPPVPLSVFPSGLKKLSLSGFGYPWEDMSKIASLPNLKVLKLRCYAFRGPKWETYGKAFLRLEFLLIEDTDLVHWTVEDGCFPCLERLFIKHCYKLEKIPEELSSFLMSMRLVDCHPLAVTCAKQMKQDKQEKGEDIHLHVLSSWDDGNLKLLPAT